MMLENEKKEDKGIWQAAKSKSNYKHKKQSKNYFWSNYIKYSVT